VSQVRVVDFFLYMKPDRRERRESLCRSPPCYTDIEHAAQLQETYSDDEEYIAAAGTAGSDEDVNSDVEGMEDDDSGESEDEEAGATGALVTAGTAGSDEDDDSGN
jgi:hypothetical protein